MQRENYKEADDKGPAFSPILVEIIMSIQGLGTFGKVYKYKADSDVNTDFSAQIQIKLCHNQMRKQ